MNIQDNKIHIEEEENVGTFENWLKVKTIAGISYDSRAEWIEINDDLPKLGGADGAQPLD